MPANSGAHCFTADGNGNYDPNGNSFFAISTVDAENQPNNSNNGGYYDWGFTLIPEDFLDTQALVGLGLGYDPTNYDSSTQPTNRQNGSPVWVTPVCDTYIFADLNGDGTPDVVDLTGDDDTNDTNVYGVTGLNEITSSLGMRVPALQSIRIFDTNDSDQTGMQLYTRTGPADVNNPSGTGGAGCKIVVAWGEDPGPASDAQPGFDVGTTIPPLASLSAAKLVQDLDGDAFVTPGDTLQYTITVKNTSRFSSFDSVKISDTLPAGTTYVAESTYKNTGGGPVKVPAGSDNGNFPLDEGGIDLAGPLPPQTTWTVSFQVTVADSASCDDNIVNTAFVRGVRGLTTIDRTVQAISPVDCPASLIVEKEAVGPATPPAFSFTLVSSDTLQPGVLPPSVSLTPPQPNSAISTTISVPAGIYTVTEGAAETGWTLTNIVCVGATGTPVSPVPGSRQARATTCPSKVWSSARATNTRDTGKLEVRKVLSPTTDLGNVQPGHGRHGQPERPFRG